MWCKVHGRWMTLGSSMMDIDMGCSFPSDCYTFRGCLCIFLPWKRRQHEDILHDPHRRVGGLLSGWLALEEHWVSLRRVLSRRWHGDAWLPGWRLVLDLRMIEMMRWSCKWGGPRDAHGLGGAIELYKLGEVEWCTLCVRCLHLGP